VPSVSSTTVLVRVSDAWDSTIYDVSDAVFEFVYEASAEPSRKNHIPVFLRVLRKDR